MLYTVENTYKDMSEEEHDSAKGTWIYFQHKELLLQIWIAVKISLPSLQLSACFPFRGQYATLKNSHLLHHHQKLQQLSDGKKKDSSQLSSSCSHSAQCKAKTSSAWHCTLSCGDEVGTFCLQWRPNTCWVKDIVLPLVWLAGSPMRTGLMSQHC